MNNRISRIGPHVYVKGSIEAIKLYKKVFGLEKKESLHWIMMAMSIIKCLQKTVSFFIGVSEDKYLQDALRNDNAVNVQTNMVFTVAFEEADDLHKTFDLLYEEGNPSTGLIAQPNAAIYCDLVDKFGGCWCLFVPDNWNLKVVPK